MKVIAWFLGQDCPDFPIQPEHGIRQCQGNKEPGTLCEFKCNNGYIMEGRGRITCSKFYKLIVNYWHHQKNRFIPHPILQN